MKILVGFKNPDTGTIENVKCGWSWVLFFSVPLLGIPLFNRKLKSLGIIALLFWIINFIAISATDGFVRVFIMYPILCTTLGFQVWLGIKGGELTAKKYLKLNFSLAEPDSELAKLALKQWCISMEKEHEVATTVSAAVAPNPQIGARKQTKSVRKDILIPFKKTESGEIKYIKLGISWTIFFFNYFGLVFFIRGVWSWGVIVLAAQVAAGLAINQFPNSNIEYQIGIYLLVLLNAYIAWKGNEWTAKFYLNHGYKEYEPENEETRLANSIWSIHQNVPEGWQITPRLLRNNGLERTVFVVITIAELFLLYKCFYFVDWVVKVRSPSCSARMTTDTIKQLLSEHGVDVFEIRDITKLNGTDKRVICTAYILSSNGTHQLNYTVDKMADGGFYVELHQE